MILFRKIKLKKKMLGNKIGKPQSKKERAANSCAIFRGKLLGLFGGVINWVVKRFPLLE
jgi:hypothetical protein